MTDVCRLRPGLPSSHAHTRQPSGADRPGRRRPPAGWAPVNGEEPAWIVAARQLAREAGRDPVRDERLQTAARRRAARRSGTDPGSPPDDAPAG